MANSFAFSFKDLSVRVGGCLLDFMVMFLVNVLIKRGVRNDTGVTGKLLRYK